MSVVLCRAVWSWIESHGVEFSTLTVAGRRLEGGPEVLFDIIYTLSENSKRKTFAWPVMTMLLACCPDILGKLAIGEGHRSPGLTKKVRIVVLPCLCTTADQVHHTGPVPREPEEGDEESQARRRCVRVLHGPLPRRDVHPAGSFGPLRAPAARLRPRFRPQGQTLSLLFRSHVRQLMSIAFAQTKLFDPHLPFLTPDGVPDVVLMTEALVSLYRLDPNSIANNPFPALLDVTAADAAKLTAVFALHILVREAC